jgi:hypothetical protein
MRAAVAENVGHDPFDPMATPRVIVAITREGGAYVGRMEADGVSGKARWEHPPIFDVNCRNLVRAMGLSIAIAIDPFPAPPVVVISPPSTGREQIPASTLAQQRIFPKPERLEYDASAGGEACPKESMVRDIVAGYLGGRSPFTSDAPSRVAVTIRRKGAAFDALIVRYDATGRSIDEREISDESCAILVEGAATIVGTWIMMTALMDSMAPPKQPPLTPPEPPKPRPAAPSPSPSKRPRFVAELGPVISFAALPAKTAFGIAGGVGVRWPWISVVVGAQGEPPASMTSLVTTPPTEVRGARVVGTLAPCVHLRLFRGCGVLVGGVVFVDANLDGVLKRYTYAYSAIGARMGADVPLVEDHLSLSLTLDALAPFAPPHATVFQQHTLLWTASHLSVGLGARLVASF